jgi:hypothetical protein
MTRLLVSALSTGGIRSSISKGVSDLLERCGASASGNVLDQCAGNYAVMVIVGDQHAC